MKFFLAWMDKGWRSGGAISNPCTAGSQQLFHLEHGEDVNGDPGVRLYYMIGATKMYVSGDLNHMYGQDTRAPTEQNLYKLSAYPA